MNPLVYKGLKLLLVIIIRIEQFCEEIIGKFVTNGHYFTKKYDQLAITLQNKNIEKWLMA